MSAENKRKYTSDEFLAMTDLEGRYELVSGEIYAMSPSPGFIHQKIVSRLCRKIGNYIEDSGGNCEVMVAPSDVKLDDENTVQPDIFVVCDNSKFDEHGCVGAPDWIIEILSPSNSDRDTVEKLALYAKTGVREYWIVDPMHEKVLVYPFAESKATGIFTFDNEVTAGIYKDNETPLKICINKIL